MEHRALLSGIHFLLDFLDQKENTMKTRTLKAIISACLLTLLSTQAQAAGFQSLFGFLSQQQAQPFECFPASTVLKTTAEIKAKVNQSMPLVVREGKNRKSTLTSVRSVSADGCNIKIVFNAKLERKRKAIKKKKSVSGHAELSASVGRFNGCLNEPEITDLEYAKTTRITERLIRGIYNKRLPDSVCPDSNGNYKL